MLRTCPKQHWLRIVPRRVSGRRIGRLENENPSGAH